MRTARAERAPLKDALLGLLLRPVRMLGAVVAWLLPPRHAPLADGPLKEAVLRLLLRPAFKLGAVVAWLLLRREEGLRLLLLR